MRQDGAEILCAHAHIRCAAGHKVGILFLHIFDNDVDERTLVGSELENIAGILGVDVDFDERLVSDDQRRFPHGRDVFANCLNVQIVSADVKLDVVTKTLINRQTFEISRNLGRRQGFEELAFKIFERAFQDEDKTLSACVYHACFLKQGEQLGRPHDGIVRRTVSFAEHKPDVVCLRGGDNCLIARLANHGQNGAFDGFDHALVGGVSAFDKGIGKGARVNGFALVHAARKAANDLREDDAGIAARPQQRAARERGTGFSSRARLS